MTDVQVGPAKTYAERLAARRAEAETADRRDERLGWARFACLVAAGIVTWMAFGRHVLPAWSVGVPLAAFAALVLRQWGATAARERAQRAAVHWARGLACLDGTWPGGGTSGDRFRDPEHPYADDLDVFGAGSLFERLCTARTPAGEATLARWLAAPSDPADVRPRHAAIGELRDRLDLREDLAVLGGDVRRGVDPTALRTWASAPAIVFAAWERWVAASAALLAVGAVVVWLMGDARPLLAVIAAEAVLAVAVRRRVAAVVAAVDRPGRELPLVAALLGRLEAETFTSPRLVALRAALSAAGDPPAAEIVRLRRLVDLLDARRNQFFAPIAFLLCWSLQCAAAIEAWRQRCGSALAAWLDAVGEIEALMALAAFAFEHPDLPYPELLDDGRVLDGEGLVHPLLARDAVANDVRLGAAPRVLVVSGSNMSGKSTLLRTVGMAVVLAQAGAPVPARSLRLSPLALGASIRVQDSLRDGRSRFYAEITRLKQLVDLAAGPRPLCFLLDEVLHGTNSHDRAIGAEAVVRTFVARGAIGLVTTHDLTLAKVADALSPLARNVHFIDDLAGAQLHFDYRLRDGVVTKSNALALMRAVGLDV
ncbi:MAG: DNA mismatch repair protein MutS [bacterium]|nr:DNA mismatch repair protein MutS [bacterium]